MHATVYAGTILGVEGLTVEVEVDIARGIPCFSIVGLPNTAVRESRERVTAAIKNAGVDFPLERITVNLAPADIRKEGAAFDLAVAMGIAIAAARGRDDESESERSRILFLGELALNGDVRPVKGVLPVLLHSRRAGFDCAVIPRDNFNEALVVDGLDVYGISHVTEALAIAARFGEPVAPPEDCAAAFDDVLFKSAPARPAAMDAAERARAPFVDFSDVVGQAAVKRALTVAAAGGHHVLMLGPPGAGKTMLARRFAALLPPLDSDDAIETTMIYSIAGLLRGAGLVSRSPFRSPHHSASDAGMIGGGSVPRPGEITLAHNGVLFLDELPEFRRNVLETLREPLEEGRIVISRAGRQVTFPARFQLVAAMNPCPCGYRGSQQRICTCAPKQMERYLGRVSGPLLDRIGIQIFVRAVEATAFANVSGHAPARDPARTSQGSAGNGGSADGPATGSGPGSAAMSPAEAAIAARERQVLRQGMLNAHLEERDIRRHCALDDDTDCYMVRTHAKLRLTARGRSHVLRVARTIADLARSKRVTGDHIGEAIQYRLRELMR